MIRKFLLLFLMYFSSSAYSDGFIVPVAGVAGGEFVVLGMEKPISESAQSHSEYEFNLDLVKNKCGYSRTLGKITCPETGTYHNARLFEFIGSGESQKQFVVTY